MTIPQVLPEHTFSIPDNGAIPNQFQDNLRPPEVQWGRCCITGEWGQVIAIDPGDIIINAPNVHEGVEHDGETGKITFTKWDAKIFEANVLFSKAGLELLLQHLNDTSVAPPGVTPELIYNWQVMYDGGEVVPQCEFDEFGNITQERTKADIDLNKVKQLTLVSYKRPNLPIYSFNAVTGEFFKNGVLISTDYAQKMPENATPYYARKVVINGSSAIGPGLSRVVSFANTSVLQLFGWIAPAGQCCIIGVDEYGAWRPYKYEGE